MELLLRNNEKWGKWKYCLIQTTHTYCGRCVVFISFNERKTFHPWGILQSKYLEIVIMADLIPEIAIYFVKFGVIYGCSVILQLGCIGDELLAQCSVHLTIT